MELLCRGVQPSSKKARSVSPHLPSVSMSLFKGLMPLALMPNDSVLSPTSNAVPLLPFSTTDFSPFFVSLDRQISLKELSDSSAQILLFGLSHLVNMYCVAVSVALCEHC